MTAARQLSADEIRALPAASTLADLAACFGVSEPTIRAAHRNGELEAIGIRVNRLGQQWRVVTSTVWAYLGIGPADRASSVPARPVAAGRRGPTASRMRAVRQGGAA